MNHRDIVEVIENEGDRIEMAQEVAEVRRSGVTNMMDRRGVVEALFDLGYDFTAEYLRDCGSDYVNMLTESGEY